MFVVLRGCRTQPPGSCCCLLLLAHASQQLPLSLLCAGSSVAPARSPEVAPLRSRLLTTLARRTAIGQLSKEGRRRQCIVQCAPSQGSNCAPRCCVVVAATRDNARSSQNACCSATPTTPMPWRRRFLCLLLWRHRDASHFERALFSATILTWAHGISAVSIIALATTDTDWSPHSSGVPPEAEDARASASVSRAPEDTRTERCRSRSSAAAACRAGAWARARAAAGWWWCWVVAAAPAGGGGGR